MSMKGDLKDRRNCSKSVETDVETSSTGEFPAEVSLSLDFDSGEKEANGKCQEKDTGGTLTGDQLPLTLDEKKSWLSRFECLPTEMFLHVCRFLEPGYLLRDVIVVSRHLYSRLACEATWKIRQKEKFKAMYPPVKVDEEIFPWSLSCIAREEQMRCWSPQPQSNVSNPNECEVLATDLTEPDKRMVTIHHAGCVDSVHLYQGGTLLVTGSRDKKLAVWNVQNCFESYTVDDSECRVFKGGPGLVNAQPLAHAGWVWALDTNEQHIISSGWDTKIKIWDKNVDGTGGKLTNISEFALGTPSLCIAADYKLIACGTFDKRIMLFDSRSNYANIHKFSVHTKSVLSLALDEKRSVIYSCGEDGLICLTDLRNFNEPLKRISLGAKNYPRAMSYRSCYPLCDWFYVGDRKGNLHLIDSDLELQKTYQVGHKRVISGIAQGLGSVITCSSDGILKVFEPSLNLKSVYEWNLSQGAERIELSAVTMANNVVAVAGGDGVVRLWSPNNI